MTTIFHRQLTFLWTLAVLTSLGNFARASVRMSDVFSQQALAENAQEVRHSLLSNWPQRTTEGRLWRRLARPTPSIVATAIAMASISWPILLHSQAVSNPYSPVAIPAVDPQRPASIFKENSIVPAAATPFLQDTFALVDRLYTPLQSHPSTDAADFDAFRKLLHFHVQLVTDQSNDITTFLTYKPNGRQVDRRLGLNMTFLQPLIAREKKGDVMARKQLQSYFLQAGHVIRIEDGTFLIHKIDQGVDRLKSGPTDALSALTAIQQEAKTDGIRIVNFAKVTGTIFALGQHWESDPTNARNAIGSFPILINSKEYLPFRERMVQPSTRQDAYSILFWLLATKEGGGLRESLAHPRAALDRHLLLAYFPPGGYHLSDPASRQKALADPRVIEADKKLLAMQTYVEAVGYEAALDFEAAMRLNTPFWSSVKSGETNPYLLATIERMSRQAIYLKPYAGIYRRFNLRADVFTHEIVASLPDETGLLLDKGIADGTIKRNSDGSPNASVAAFQFLVDPRYTEESTVAARPPISFPIPTPSKPMIERTGLQLAATPSPMITRVINAARKTAVLVNDPAVAAQLNALQSSQISFATDNPGAFLWVNASVSQNHIFVNPSILPEVSDEELIACMAHEVTHIGPKALRIRQKMLALNTTLNADARNIPTKPMLREALKSYFILSTDDEMAAYQVQLGVWITQAQDRKMNVPEYLRFMAARSRSEFIRLNYAIFAGEITRNNQWLEKELRVTLVFNTMNFPPIYYKILALCALQEKPSLASDPIIVRASNDGGAIPLFQDRLFLQWVISWVFRPATSAAQLRSSHISITPHRLRNILAAV